MPLRDLMTKKGVFKDYSKLSFEYVPQDLIHREEAQRKLALLFRPVLEGRSQNVFITGKVGVGKTVLARWFTREFGDLGEEEGLTVKTVLVNCRRRNSPAAALLAVLNEFTFFPDRGYSVTEMLETLKGHLTRTGTSLIVILDEVDYLIQRKGSDLVYFLTRFYDEYPDAKGSLSLILISQKHALEMLDTASLSTFKRSNIMNLSKYNRDELRDIVLQRCGLALKDGTWTDDVVDLMADIASESGDARFSIELLERAGLAVDERGGEVITVEDVRMAKASISPVMREELLADMDLHQKLTFLAVAKKLTKEAYTTTGEVEKEYAGLCEEVGETPRKHTQFWKYLKELENLGLLDGQVSGSATKGTTTVIKLSIPDVPVAELIDVLYEQVEGK